jgi:hypothetical protein
LSTAIWRPFVASVSRSDDGDALVVRVAEAKEIVPD